MSILDVLANEPEVSKADALAEYRKQKLGEADLVADLGDHETYDGLKVIEALGY